MKEEMTRVIDVLQNPPKGTPNKKVCYCFKKQEELSQVGLATASQNPRRSLISIFGGKKVSSKTFVQDSSSSLSLTRV
jgi:3-phosphoglycerate kinase